MPTWIRLSVIAVGGLIFALHAWKALAGMRLALSPTQKLEAAGALVPGLGGLLLVAAVHVPSVRLRLVISAAGFLLLVAGRPLYELVVFRGR